MPAAATFCTGCGQPSTDCQGCGRELDPPRFCPECGRRMTVSVIPTGWVARCRDHAELRSALTNSPYQIELYREYLETALFPDPATQQEFREWYIHKYRDRRPDLIIALGASPLKFLVESHKAILAFVFREVRL